MPEMNNETLLKLIAERSTTKIQDSLKHVDALIDVFSPEEILQHSPVAQVASNCRATLMAYKQIAEGHLRHLEQQSNKPTQPGVEAPQP